MPVDGDKVRTLARARGVTLAELAERAGMTRQALHKLLSPAGNPTLATLEAIAGALRVDVQDLLTEKE